MKMKKEETLQTILNDINKSKKLDIKLLLFMFKCFKL